jgi:hypothetical protein
VVVDLVVVVGISEAEVVSIAVVVLVAHPWEHRTAEVLAVLAESAIPLARVRPMDVLYM